MSALTRSGDHLDVAMFQGCAIGSGKREAGSVWATVPVRRRILGIVRNLTALDRLRDVLTCIADDFRLEIRFTIVEGSEFAADLSAHLNNLGMRVVDWSEATGENFDLAISPNSNGNLHELGIPIMTLPHGAGHHKHRPTDSGFSADVSGLSRVQLGHNGRIVPTIIGLPHQHQIDVLRESCPEAVDRAEVIGDPCYDRLRASLPMRALYRDELGTGSRRLVLISSTWGERSLFGRQPDLPRRLTAKLDPAEFQFALVLHPNVWDKHSEFQIREWTRRARDAGLILVPPQHGWKSTMVAADLVIADHGSLAYYGACLGKPLLLAEFGDDEIVPGSPMSRLGALADRLDPGDDLAERLAAAQPIADAEYYVDKAFAFPGNSADRIRTIIYSQLGLELPSWPPYTAPVERYSP